MADLPHPMLASYWIPAVGIGKPEKWVTVPLTDIPNYVLADGKPQTGIVFLTFGRFSITPQNFKPAWVTIDPGVLQQLTLQPGQTRTAVQQLQAAGIKVLLSIVGDRTGLGWDTIPYGQGQDRFANMVAFAEWLQTDVIKAYGLDGIDIDDEFREEPVSSYPRYPQAFVDMVGILRHFLDGKLLTKALWEDDEHFQTTVAADAPFNAGAKLSDLLDLGCTMGYGYSVATQKSTIAEYKGYGMKWNQLCVGVQAGFGNWMTTLDKVSALAQWAAPKTGEPPILGMMLFTFPQDIQQWTHNPQNSPGYMYPNANDHEWQRTIVENMWGPGNWKVVGR